MLPKLLTRHERHTALALIGLSLTCAGFLLVRWYDRNTVLLPVTSGEYTEAIVGTPRTTNPLLATTPAELDLAIVTHRGLMKRSSRGELVPDLADYVTTSGDQTTYHIQLKPNLYWSDGVPLTSGDVVFTFTMAQDKALGSPKQAAFSGVSLDAQGSLIILKLREPYAEFLANLTLGIVPRHIWQGVAPGAWLAHEASLKPIGTGPFMVKTVSRDRQGELRGITLEPNPYTHTKPPFLKKFSLRFYPDFESASSALQHGLVQSAGAISKTMATQQNGGRFVNYELTLPQYTALLYRSESSAILKDVNVRQALGLALSRTAIITEALSGNAVPLASLPDTPTTKTTISGSINTEEAAKKMEKAGYKKDNGVWGTSEGPLELTLTFSDTPNQKRIAEAVLQQWQAFGLTMKANAVPTYQLANEILKPRAFEILLVTETLGLEFDPYPFWHSSQSVAPGVNLAGFKNQTADKLMVELRQTSDTAKKNELYQKLQQLLVDESPATFLFSTTYNLTMSREVGGFAVERLAEPAGRFTQVEEWYTKTARAWKP